MPGFRTVAFIVSQCFGSYLYAPSGPARTAIAGRAAGSILKNLSSRCQSRERCTTSRRASPAELARAWKDQRPLMGEARRAEQPSGKLAAQNIRQVAELGAVGQVQGLSRSGKRRDSHRNAEHSFAEARNGTLFVAYPAGERLAIQLKFERNAVVFD